MSDSGRIHPRLVPNENLTWASAPINRIQSGQLNGCYLTCSAGFNSAKFLTRCRFTVPQRSTSWDFKFSSPKGVWVGQCAPIVRHMLS